MIRFISSVARLRLSLFTVLFSLASFEQVVASTSTPIFGSDINKLVVDTMLAKGMTGSPRLSKSRKFLACRSGMGVEPMFGSDNIDTIRIPGTRSLRKLRPSGKETSSSDDVTFQRPCSQRGSGAATEDGFGGDADHEHSPDHG